jgi:hypothetical protein
MQAGVELYGVSGYRVASGNGRGRMISWHDIVTAGRKRNLTASRQTRISTWRCGICTASPDTGDAAVRLTVMLSSSDVTAVRLLDKSLWQDGVQSR